MSREGLTQALTRAALEPDFRARVRQDPSLHPRGPGREGDWGTNFSKKWNSRLAGCVHMG